MPSGMVPAWGIFYLGQAFPNMKNPIPHIDLWPGNRPVIEGFLRDVRGLCRQGAFSGGPYVARFEDEFAAYLGVKHCIGVNSGTSALHLALLALGIGPGDEVIVPAYTFAGTVWGIIYCGATPVFADVDAATGNISPAAVANAVSRRTRAVIAVHLFGQAADLAGIRRAIRVKGGKRIRLIEDAAQAHGGRHVTGPLGTLADIGCFSFYPTKNLGAAGEGGAVVTANAGWAKRIRLLRNHNAEERYVHLGTGYNYRMDGIQGLFLSRKLKRLDAANRERARIASAYLAAVEGGPITPLCTEVPGSAWHAFVCRVPRRAAFLKLLAEECIGHAIYYPRILPELPAFKPFLKGAARGKAAFPNASLLSRESVCLPLYPGLKSTAVRRICKVLRDWR